MWSRGVIFQWLPAHPHRRYRARGDAPLPGWMRALAPWLAALETDSDQGVSRGQAFRGARARRRGAKRVRTPLYAVWRGAVLDYLYGLTRNHVAATDLMQETFLRAWASATPLDTIQQPNAWLYRMATNLALNQSRRQRRFVWLPLETVEPLGAAGSSDRWLIPLRWQATCAAPMMWRRCLPGSKRRSCSRPAAVSSRARSRCSPRSARRTCARCSFAPTSAFGRFTRR